MKIDRTGWHVDVIHDLFNIRDQECIKRTPVEVNFRDDKIYWNKENSGLYTIKSAYHLLQAQKGLWNETDSTSMWKKMWRLKVPPIVHNLLLRSMVGCLPINVMLQQK